MEYFTEVVFFITPTWFIAIVTMLNAIFLFKRKDSTNHRYYPLHAIGLLLTSAFYILMIFDHAYSQRELIAMFRVSLMWVQFIWLFSSLSDFRGGKWR